MAAIAAGFGAEGVAGLSGDWDEPHALSETSRAVSRSVLGLMMSCVSFQSSQGVTP